MSKTHGLSQNSEKLRFFVLSGDFFQISNLKC